MGATRARVKRAYDTGRLIYTQTGSMRPVVLFFARFASKKIPLLYLHAKHVRKSRTVIERIATVRAADERPQLAIKVTGGIGDFLVIARFLRDFTVSAEDFIFDIYASTPHTAPWVFSVLPGYRETYADSLFEHVVAHYDAGIALNQFAVVHHEKANWRRFRPTPKLASLLGTIMRYRSKIDLYIQKHPWMDNHLARIAVYSNLTRQNFLHSIAGIKYGGAEYPIQSKLGFAEQLGLTGRRYVTIHNGFDPGFVISGDTATKCYRHFDEVVGHLKRRTPDLMVVQVGISTSTPIPKADLNLINKTTLAEVAEVIRHSALHIDNEGGLVHMAACMGVPSCVTFGPTPADYFEYPGNLSVLPPTCGGCWWINQTWMDRCPRGFAEPICMQHDPKMIAEAVLKRVATLKEHDHEALSRV